jgi:GNAT superfamily N-acetyltransferase
VKDPVIFKPIDFASHSELSVSFRADSFACSFGTDRHFWERYGTRGEKYLAQLKSEGWLKGFHVWNKDQIIGQIELGVNEPSLRKGHINLYYLVADMRRKGYGSALDDFACEFLRSTGATHATLTVSPINESAIRFYEMHGWHNLGQNAEEARNSTSGLSVLYMEKRLDNPDQYRSQ